MRSRLGCLVLVVAAAGCGDDDLLDPVEPAGTLRVAIATIGADLDSNGYSLAVDGAAPRAVGLNETAMIPGLPAGPHEVVLSGVAGNCGVEGDSQRPFTVSAGDTSRVAFAVTCRATGVRVVATTTGIDLDPDGYQVSVDGGPSQPLGALGGLIVTRLSPGPHTVTLTGLAGNCTLSAENPRAVIVTVGEITDVSFAVTCVAATGALAVTTVTTGIDLDADYYVIQVPGRPLLSIPVNGTAVLGTLAAGDVGVTLTEVATNCGVAGNNPRTVTVVAGGSKTDTVRTTFEVQCVAATGAVEVTAVTSGTDFDLDGYTIRVGDGPPQALAMNGVVTFVELGPGSHDILLEGLATNCAVVAPNPRTVTVTTGGATRDTARTTFEATCVDADMLAYARWEWDWYWYSELPTLSVTYADGSARVALGWGSDPSWSPDGTTLAYTSIVCPYYCYPGGLARTQTDGTGALQLTTNESDTDPAWQPDGTRIAFTRGQTLHLMNPDGSGITPLAAAGSAANPTWSPDGTALAYTCQVVSGNQDICRINADGTGFTQLTSDTARDLRPAWSPDGSQIVFTTTRFSGSHELGLMNPDGSGLTRVAPGIGALQPAWSSDGTRIVYTAFRCDIYSGCSMLGLAVISADGSGYTQITNGVDNGAAWRP